MFWTGISKGLVMIHSAEISNLDWVDALAYEPRPVGVEKKGPKSDTGKNTIKVISTVFSQPTHLSFQVSGHEPVFRISIYNLRGRLVRSLKLSKDYIVFWDGKDNAGNRVKPGAYIVKLADGRKALSKKIILKA